MPAPTPPPGRRSPAITAAVGLICMSCLGLGAFVIARWLSAPAARASTVPARPSGPPAPPPGPTAPAQTFRDLPYAGGSPAQKLDLYLPARTGVAVPLVVVIHGGGFSSGDKADEPQIVRAVTAAGYAAASINYRLSGEARFPAAVQDAKAAVRWLRSQAAGYGLDPNRIAAWGTSAGGNIAAMVGVTGSTPGLLDDAALGNAHRSSALIAVVDWYGPSDFLTMDAQARARGGCPGTPEKHDPGNSSESLYLGAPIRTVPARVRASSPISYLTAAGGAVRPQPSFLLVAGSADCTVPHAQSQQFAAALRKAHVPVTLNIVEHAGHADPAIYKTQLTPSIAFLRAVFGH